MAEGKTFKPNATIANEWLEEDNLMLLECWSRDGYTFKDIALRIGIDERTLRYWRGAYPEIDKALKQGRQIVDYKVENALLKSALGFRTKEVKVTTLLRFGKVIETTTETLEKDVVPNVTACQVWLYNRLPDKWKKNRDNLIEIDEEDTHIQVTVTRANDQSQTLNKAQPEPRPNHQNTEEDEEWLQSVNSTIEISKKKKEDIDKDAKNSKEKKRSEEENIPSKTVVDQDYWPDDWEDEE